MVFIDIASIISEVCKTNASHFAQTNVWYLSILAAHKNTENPNQNKVSTIVTEVSLLLLSPNARIFQCVPTFDVECNKKAVQKCGETKIARKLREKKH